MKLINCISKMMTLLLITAFSTSYGQQISKTNQNLGDWKTNDGKYFLQVYLTKEGLGKANLDNKQNSLAAPLAVLEVTGGDNALSLTGDGWSGKIEKEKLNLSKGAEKLTFVHYVRTSPTMNAAPPKGAIVLFDGKNLDEWYRLHPKEWIKGDGPVEGWKILPGGILEAGVGTGSIITRKMFGDFKLHAEVRLLGDVTNGGIYMMSRYEMNIKDSYGQIGGAPSGAFGNISKPADFYPSVNMAYPPMVWQTFDIEFRAPRFDATGTKKIESARISIVHNGVQTYKDAPMEEVKGATGILGEAGVGPIYLQEHGTAYQFRNIWVIDQTVKGTENAHTPVQASADGAVKKGGGGRKGGGGKKNGTGKKGGAEGDLAAAGDKPAKKKGSSNKNASADYDGEKNPAYAAVTVMITPDASGKPAKPAGFTHPGVLVNLAQLEEIKKRVAAGTQPQKSAFEALKESPLGALGYTPQPRDTVSCGPYSNPNLGCKDEQNDCAAAYTQALLWFITGNKTYAESAIKIMNAWSTNLVGGHNYANGPVQAAWCGSVWPRAAEIIRYTYKGWSDSDIAKFQNMLRVQYLPSIIHGDCENGNKELAMAEAIINIGVFNDDRAVFDLGLKMWRGRTPAYIYLKTDGPKPIDPPGCGPAIWGNKGFTPEFVDGLMQETARDSHHPWMAFASMANAAETARQQGVDLYAEEGKRMVAALEFQAQYLAPNKVPAPENLQFALQPTWEIAYNHFVNRMGMSLPKMKAVLPTNRPTRGDHHMLWETLTHADMGGIGLGPVKK
ncbi:MAG: DUF1080 domain-containing protein [Candidatus Pedobacter colombiensis]|uniref:DUF1080 domain-containing protein n=1 Tax=Candidatus Pedobacter colombiensis TaxID=3121371 RepID=A0AAJ5W904_9SPHI|nr:family 16 glycoside hydrolase [Pedobacter sp.]WEK20242.1 MAG: DUF1080 domain-containing protein [Pedobacter sp.]